VRFWGSTDAFQPSISGVSALVIIRNRQRKIPFDLAFIRAVAEFALPACQSAIRSGSAPLNSLEEIEATIVGNPAIAKVHREYFDDPEPTDVITFPYGEILIGAGVVSENAARFGNSPSEEAALCVVHGLLHLAGWRDRTERAAKDMAGKQEQIFKLARRMVCSRDQ
jgi:probable rRNA maturation factor